MAGVSLKKVSKKFGDTTAVEDLTLEIKDGEFFSLLGPSGAGKTTLLRMIAGVEKPDKGNICIDDVVVTDIPPKNREVTMVFQSYALFPHKTVYENMAYPLRKRKIPEAEIKKIVEETAEILHISPLLSRLPKQLSGGERQRVGLGRAMVRQPKVCLLDEPLTNLDAKLRVEMRGEFKKICKNLQTTIVYATPDQLEAVTMADRIAVLDRGRVLQYDTPDSLYDHPKNLFVAGFIGSPAMNFIDCTLVEKNEKTYLDAAEFKYEITDKAEKIRKKCTTQEIVLGTRPEDIELDVSRQKNAIQADVSILEPMGHRAIVHVQIGKITLVANVNLLGLKAGDRIWLRFNKQKIHIFDKKTGISIM